MKYHHVLINTSDYEENVTETTTSMANTSLGNEVQLFLKDLEVLGIIIAALSYLFKLD